MEALKNCNRGRALGKGLLSNNPTERPVDIALGRRRMEFSLNSSRLAGTAT